MNIPTLIMMALLVYMIFANIKLFKRYKQNKKYIKCYQDMLNQPEEAVSKIEEYINSEQSMELINKANILLLYAKRINDIDYQDTLEALDLKEVFFKKGALSNENIAINCDSFVWLMLDMSLAYSKNDTKLLEGLKNAISQLAANERLEYAQLMAIYNLLSANENDYTILSDMLLGDYHELKYEKNMIGLYKRLSAATLAAFNKLNDEYYEEDLHHFNETVIGHSYLSNLKIDNKYPVLVSSSDDKQEEPKEETTKTDKEEEK